MNNELPAGLEAAFDQFSTMLQVHEGEDGRDALMAFYEYAGFSYERLDVLTDVVEFHLNRDGQTDPGLGAGVLLGVILAELGHLMAKNP